MAARRPRIRISSRGVLDGPDVLSGGWYRIVTSAFMHYNLAHIAVNMFSLYQLGSFVETMLGGGRMLVVYAISIVGSGLGVVVFSPNEATLGASGAIYGLFGTLFAIGVRMGKPGRALISQTFPVLVLNLVFTFAVPGISKAGHLGGLVSGFAAGLAFYAMRRRRRPRSSPTLRRANRARRNCFHPSNTNRRRSSRTHECAARRLHRIRLRAGRSPRDETAGLRSAPGPSADVATDRARLSRERAHAR